MARARRKPVPLESEVQRSMRTYLSMRRDVDVWRANTRVVDLPGAGGKKRPVRFGVKGQADLSGIIKPFGVRLEIELKRPEYGEQSEEQRIFEARIRRSGGIYLLVTSVQECREKLDAAIAELRTRFDSRAEESAALSARLLVLLVAFLLPAFQLGLDRVVDPVRHALRVFEIGLDRSVISHADHHLDTHDARVVRILGSSACLRDHHPSITKIVRMSTTCENATPEVDPGT